ncbi:intradiol ring-cleavage dioxygenase [Nocardia arthritidis]|uniref:Protocatechuate dioxygenase n=1 Tax=Nocardia arthritidis TaxID=228602 RepID=A0A6G9YHL6_9NOCA|nr:intradiol ring-cleavage dioxygenase [Nocardia arthritidis]QIS12674.1 protocatechuate dioxygenase [Nocardia arthritidis]
MLGTAGISAVAASVVTGAVSGARTTAPAELSCSTILSPEEIEGPYFVDNEPVRGDISEGKPGLPVNLRLTLIDIGSCTPMVNAMIAVWHCDAFGFYSRFTDQPPNGPDGPPMPPPPDDGTFLRGVQFTGADGTATFRTLFPGWYIGRAVHIHVKVKANGGSSYIHTGQLYFDESLTEQVAALDPYNQHDFRRWRNDEDDIYTQQGGADSMLTVTPVNPDSLADGLDASINLGIQPT